MGKDDGGKKRGGWEGRTKEVRWKQWGKKGEKGEKRTEGGTERRGGRQERDYSYLQNIIVSSALVWFIILGIFE